MLFSSWDEGGVGQWWGHAATQHGERVLPALSVKGQELGSEGEGGPGLLLWWLLNGFATCHSLGVVDWHFGCITLLSPGRPGQSYTSLRCFLLASALYGPCTAYRDG